MADRTDHRWIIDALEEGIARIEEDGERIIQIPRYCRHHGGIEEARSGRRRRALIDPRPSVPARECVI